MASRHEARWFWGGPFTRAAPPAAGSPGPRAVVAAAALAYAVAPAAGPPPSSWRGRVRRPAVWAAVPKGSRGALDVVSEGPASRGPAVWAAGAREGQAVAHPAALALQESSCPPAGRDGDRGRRDAWPVVRRRATRTPLGRSPARASARGRRGLPRTPSPAHRSPPRSASPLVPRTSPTRASTASARRLRVLTRIGGGCGPDRADPQGELVREGSLAWDAVVGVLDGEGALRERPERSGNDRQGRRACRRPPEKCWHGRFIRDLAVGPDGQLWVAGDVGVVRMSVHE
jgi:hypothetical protein